ncbi:crossover junction endonuclease EME1 isoform X2 [Austrofundulus limnaeus]|uniref:Crossover junction endonuclease EME1 isoform X2 n=1 Tax=Austrofundulus limnaeus TaxID=52670 RepID=A0A2I4D315_AUSLI|nr:PREDICTED: crossover junction endonuclease EME1 isoform X2 [Austrofundulus limnaeus]
MRSCQCSPSSPGKVKHLSVSKTCFQPSACLQSMVGDSDSTSDLDEELPVFTFLQPAGSSSLTCQRGAAGPAVMLISSDSDDEEPDVPLAQRLKHRQDASISTSSVLHRGGGAELGLPSEQVKQTSQVEDGAPLKNRAKRTAEEVQESREQAVRRRRRQLTDTQQEQQRRAVAQAARALRPDECIKHMLVCVDPAVLQVEGGGALLAAVQALGCSCVVERQVIPRSVSWARSAPCGQDEGGCVPEDHVVMQMTSDDFIPLIHSYIQEARHGRSDCGPTLTTWIQQQQRTHPNKTLSLAVMELEKYFRVKKSHSQKKFREAVVGEETRGKKGRKAGAEGLPEVSRVDVEEALVHLQLHSNVSVQFLSTWKEFSDYITMTTKAVAEAPYKREREKTGFSFYLESEWAGGQRVEKGGKGLLQVWKRQIQQLSRVSPDVAAAILAEYPSPHLLRKAYSQCRTESHKVSVLSGLLIRRGEGITSTTRRVGPELSKRLYLMMHCSDPEYVLDGSL